MTHTLSAAIVKVLNNNSALLAAFNDFVSGTNAAARLTSIVYSAVAGNSNYANVAPNLTLDGAGRFASASAVLNSGFDIISSGAPANIDLLKLADVLAHEGQHVVFLPSVATQLINVALGEPAPDGYTVTLVPQLTPPRAKALPPRRKLQSPKGRHDAPQPMAAPTHQAAWPMHS